MKSPDFEMSQIPKNENDTLPRWTIHQIPEGTLILSTTRSQLLDSFINEKIWEKKQNSLIPHQASREVYINSIPEMTKGIVVKRRYVAEQAERYHNLMNVGPKMFEDLSSTPEKIFHPIRRANLASLSVMNELDLNRQLSEAYFQKYHESLPIEVPLGGFIDRDGTKYSFFEAITAGQVVSRNELMDDPQYKEDLATYYEWLSSLRSRVEALHIPLELHDFQGVMAVHEDGTKELVLIDSDRWVHNLDHSTVVSG